MHRTTSLGGSTIRQRTSIRRPLFSSFLGGSAGGGFQATGNATAYSWGVNYDHTFSPTLLTELRFGVAHLRNIAQQTDYGTNDARTLGIPGNGPNGTNNSLQTSGQIAFLVNTFNHNSAYWLFGVAAVVARRIEYRCSKQLDQDTGKSCVKGRRGHSACPRRSCARQQQRGCRSVLFPGEPNFCSRCKLVSTERSGDRQTMSPVFSLMFPTRLDRTRTAPRPAYRQWWEFFFVSDKWQATPKLTVDLGLRYELYPPATPARAGGFVNYNPATNQLVAAGVAGNPSNLGMKSDWTNFAPRLGASYRATDKIVLRAGFGVSYVPFVDNTYAYNYPIKTSTFYTNTPTYGAALNPIGGYVNFVTGVPATPEAVFGSNGTLTESAANGTIGLANLYIPLNFKNPYVELVECCTATSAPRRHFAANRLCRQSRNEDQFISEHQRSQRLWREYRLRSSEYRVWKDCGRDAIFQRLFRQFPIPSDCSSPAVSARDSHSRRR